MRLDQITISGVKGLNDTYHFSPIALIIGGMGSGKTTAVDAAAILQTGRHELGDKSACQPKDVLALLGSGEIEISGSYVDVVDMDGPLTVKRSFAWKADGSGADHKLTTNAGSGGINAHQRCIDESCGADHMPFKVRSILRETESKQQDTMLDMMAGAADLDLAEIKARIGELPEGIGSKRKDAIGWLGDVRDGMGEKVARWVKRRKELDAAYKQARTSTATGSPEIVADCERKISELRGERDSIVGRLASVEVAKNSRVALADTIDGVQRKIVMTEEISATKPEAAARLGSLTREASDATGRAVSANDRVREQTATINRLGQERSEKNDARVKARERYDVLTGQLAALTDGACPTCGQEVPDSLIEKIKDQVEAAAIESDHAAKEVDHLDGEIKFARERASSISSTAEIAERERKRLADERDRASEQLDAATKAEGELPGLREKLAARQAEMLELHVGDDAETLEASRDAIDSQIEEAEARLSEARAAMETRKGASQIMRDMADLDDQIADLKGKLDTINHVRIDAARQLAQPTVEAMRPFLAGYAEFEVQLVDERNKACFRPGLIKDGVFRALGQLSGGEQTLAIPAYAVAIASSRPDGYRPLILDDFERVSASHQEAFLREILRLVEEGKLCQALITWNVEDENQIPEWLRNHELVGIINREQPAARAVAVGE